MLCTSPHKSPPHFNCATFTMQKNIFFPVYIQKLHETKGNQLKLNQVTLTQRSMSLKNRHLLSD